jgi:hypothetical protein
VESIGEVPYVHQARQIGNKECGSLREKFPAIVAAVVVVVAAAAAVVGGAFAGGRGSQGVQL